jgi:hypothetical protein
LNDTENEEFCKAIEKIEADIRFINSSLSIINAQIGYFDDVKNELKFVGIPMQQFDSYVERYEQMLESDPVHNFAQMQQEYQKVKDLYYQHMKQYADKMTAGYNELTTRMDDIKTEADEYPHDWNVALYDKISRKELSWKKYIVSKIVIKDYEIRCDHSQLQLRDMDCAIKMLVQLKTEVDVMSTEIVTSKPTPIPTPTSKPQPKPGGAQPQPTPIPIPQPEPKERKLRSQLPTGQLSVAEYKQWLMQQLSMVNQYDSNDILKFDE